MLKPQLSHFLLSEMELQDGVVVQQFVCRFTEEMLGVQTRSFLSVWMFCSRCGSEFSPYFFLNGLWVCETESMH